MAADDFTKNVIRLFFGASLAQALPIAISPILTRLYEPSDFGILSLFLTISSIAGAVANGRYDLAIMLPKKDEEAVNIAVVCILNLCFFCFFMFFIVIGFSKQIIIFLKCPLLESWLYVTPISTFLVGLFCTLSSINTRFKMYQDISKATVFRTVISAILQVVLGVFKIGAAGLIFGNLFSQFFSNRMLFNNVLKKNLLSHVNVSAIKDVFFRYINFLRYSVFEALLNLISRNAVTFLIAVYFSIDVVGLYSLVQRVLMLPIALIGDSVSRVFFQEASIEKSLTGSVTQIFLKTLVRLAVLILPLGLMGYFFVEDLFVFCFGEEWRIAGSYAQVSMPAVVMQFIVSPLTYTWSLFEKLKEAMWSQVIFFCISIGTFLFLVKKDCSFSDILEYHSLIIALYYFGLLLVFWGIVSQKRLVAMQRP